MNGSTLCHFRYCWETKVISVKWNLNWNGSWLNLFFITFMLPITIVFFFILWQTYEVDSNIKSQKIEVWDQVTNSRSHSVLEYRAWYFTRVILSYIQTIHLHIFIIFSFHWHNFKWDIQKVIICDFLHSNIHNTTLRLRFLRQNIICQLKYFYIKWIISKIHIVVRSNIFAPDF